MHQQAYATGEPYQMIERIVRPDGSVRYLSSNGQVVMDEHGAPVRMRGTCIDITDRVLAEREREQMRTPATASLVEAAPDAILLARRRPATSSTPTPGHTTCSAATRPDAGCGDLGCCRQADGQGVEATGARRLAARWSTSPDAW